MNLSKFRTLFKAKFVLLIFLVLSFILLIWQIVKTYRTSDQTKDTQQDLLDIKDEQPNDTNLNVINSNDILPNDTQTNDILPNDVQSNDILPNDTQTNEIQPYVVYHERSNIENNNKDPSEPVYQEVDPYYTIYQYDSIEDVVISYENYLKNLEEVRSNFEAFLGRITENSTFKISPNQKNKENVEKIKKYLWGDNLWQVDPNFTKDRMRLERTISEKLNEEREVEILLENINLPKNIRNEVLNENFIYRLHPKIPITNLANKNTMENLIKSFKNKFLIDLISKIVIVKQEDLKLSTLEKKVLLEKTCLLNDTNTSLKLENDFVFLDFRLTEISESEIRKGLKTLNGLTPEEINFCNNYELQIFENRLNSIINFLADEGLQIPDSMIDCITGEFIKNPVLLDKDDIFFLNSTTKERLIKDGAKNPFSKKIIFPYYFLPTSERKIHDEKTRVMEVEIDNFIMRLGQRFFLFFDHLRDYDETIQLICLNK